MIDARLYLLQRLSALLMAPLVLTHLFMMIYAVRGGLTAAEILSRTQGSWGWALFYGFFVVCVSLHAAIGTRVVVSDYLTDSPKVLRLVTWLTASALLVTGLRAVWAVVAP